MDYQLAMFKKAVRSFADTLTDSGFSAWGRNVAFVDGLKAYDPNATVVIVPFLADEPGWVTLIEHPRFGDIVVSGL